MSGITRTYTFNMTVLEAVILGIVQGLTEFLPVSSSGHLLLAANFLGVGQLGLGFELVCHLGTLAAIIIVMRREVWDIARKPLAKPMRLIVTASVPTAIIAGLISVLFRDALYGNMLVYCFIITGILLLCCGFAANKTAPKPLTYPHAAIIGAAQGIAALPGLSRSGATIAAATILGYPREQAARFSFLISIPVIVGSSIVEIAFNGIGGGIDAPALIAALISSFISGLVAVKFMLKLLEKHSLDGFAIYLMLLSVFMLLNDYVLHIF